MAYNFKVVYKPTGVISVTANSLMDAITEAAKEPNADKMFMVVATEHIEKGAYQAIYFEEKGQAQINSSDPANKVVFKDATSLVDIVDGSSDEPSNDSTDSTDDLTDYNEIIK